MQLSSASDMGNISLRASTHICIHVLGFGHHGFLLGGSWSPKGRRRHHPLSVSAWNSCQDPGIRKKPMYTHARTHTHIYICIYPDACVISLALVPGNQPLLPPGRAPHFIYMLYAWPSLGQHRSKTQTKNHRLQRAAFY